MTCVFIWDKDLSLRDLFGKRSQEVLERIVRQRSAPSSRSPVWTTRIYTCLESPAASVEHPSRVSRLVWGQVCSPHWCPSLVAHRPWEEWILQELWQLAVTRGSTRAKGYRCWHVEVKLASQKCQGPSAWGTALTVSATTSFPEHHEHRQRPNLKVTIFQCRVRDPFVLTWRLY